MVWSSKGGVGEGEWYGLVGWLEDAVCCLGAVWEAVPHTRAKPGSKPTAEHESSTLTNLHPKPFLSPCRLEALYFNPKP